MAPADGRFVNLLRGLLIYPEALLQPSRGQVLVLNHALAGIPAERVRYHTCYGINMGPRVHDLELKHIIDIMLRINAGATERRDYLKELRKDAVKYRAAGIIDQVMLSFTTDPYHPGDTELTRHTIEALIEHGLAFCTLTKGGTRALRDLDLFRPTRDAFATTLTTLDDAFSLKWERNAPVPSNRILALKRFHKAGVFTWVSLEPTLDVDASVEIVRQTHEFVDLYKVGRVNYLPMTKTTDWKDYTERMVETLTKVGANAYIKADLQQYLPAGYDNPLRVPQHH